VADDGSQKRKPDFRTAVEDVKAVATVFAMEAESVLGRRTARVLGVLALFAVLVVVLLALLDWYIAPSSAEQKQAFVVTLAQILGGAALLFGLYFTWRTLQVDREGQITERFTRAIDQLGSERLEIRLGGIYALERIARDSERDHWPIMEVLTAYIREHAPRQSEEESNENDPLDIGTVTPPAPDIQAILTVLRRRTRHYGAGEVEPIVLGGTDLRRAPLAEANLAVASLQGADLREANLALAVLWRADFRGADLRGANLQQADLRAANLQGVDLRNATFAWANLWRAVFKANLIWATFTEADLREAIFAERSNVRGAIFQGTDLRGANLRGAKNLEQAQIEQAYGDWTTLLPAHLKAPASWHESADEQE
jgi:hypothetical protein